MKAFGLLTAMLGFGLLRGVQRDACAWREAAIAGAATLACVDVYYVRKRRTSPAYLLGGVAESGILVLLGLARQHLGRAVVRTPNSGVCSLMCAPRLP